MIADISMEDARTLHRIFIYLRLEQAKEKYQLISQEARGQFENHFKLDFAGNGF